MENPTIHSSPGTIPFTSNKPMVSHSLLVAFTWVGLALAVAVAALQGALYSRELCRPRIPDLLNLLAVFFLLIHAVLVTVAAPPMYKLMMVRAGLQAPDAGLPAVITRYYRLQFAHDMIFWTCLWCIKAAFLSLYWPMIAEQRTALRWQRQFFYGVVGLTLSAYLACLLPLPLACPSFSYNSPECNSATSTQRVFVGLWFSATMDIITDLLILAVPLTILSLIKMPLSWSQRARMATVLTLCGLVVAAAITRIVITNLHRNNPELSSLLFWSSIESSVAVIIGGILSIERLSTVWHNRQRQEAMRLHPWPMGNLTRVSAGGDNGKISNSQDTLGWLPPPQTGVFVDDWAIHHYQNYHVSKQLPPSYFLN